MQTHKMTAAALTAGLAAVWMATAWLATGTAFGREVTEGFLGSVRARTYTVSYKMPLDVGTDDNWKPGERIDEARTRVHVPEFYGDLVQMTAHGPNVVLWYRDEGGVLRNVVLKDADTELVHVVAAPTREIAFTYR